MAWIIDGRINLDSVGDAQDFAGFIFADSSNGSAEQFVSDSQWDRLSLIEPGPEVIS